MGPNHRKGVSLVFQYKWTAIFNSEFNIPEPGNKITGSCTASGAIGVPTNFEAKKIIRCRVNMRASISGTDELLFDVTSISEFAVVDDDSSEDVIREKADKECTPIAFRKTSEKIADATEVLCGQRIDISIFS